MHKLFTRSPFFDFETLRILGEAVNGGSEVVEVLEAVEQIATEDPDRWGQAWKKLADRSEKSALAALNRSDCVTARRIFLKASNYARAAGYMLTGTSRHPHPRALAAHEWMMSLFRQFTALSPSPIHRLWIPFNNLKMPAYLYLPAAQHRLKGRKTPVVVNVGGADAPQEELFFMLPAAGPELGYCVLTFDGPGQGLCLRSYGARMQPDFETVVEKVLDFLIDYSTAYPELELDLDCVAIAGASMGGYFALRGSTDPRIRACAAIDPFYDMWDFGTSHISPLFMRLWTNGWIPDRYVDAIIGAVGRVSFQMKWEVSTAGQFFGTDSPCSILRRMADFSLVENKGTGCILDRVHCPVLVSGAAHSLYLDVNAHTMRVVQSLAHLGKEDVEVWIPESKGEGATQAKMGALTLVNERVFTFFDRKLHIHREK